MLEMVGNGAIEFGNHTFDAHKIVDGKPALLSMNRKQIEQDLEQVNELFDSIGIPRSRSIAYPFGQASDTVILAANSVGMKLGFTVKPGFVYKDSPPMLLNRIIIPPVHQQISLESCYRMIPMPFLWGLKSP